MGYLLLAAGLGLEAVASPLAAAVLEMQERWRERGCLVQVLLRRMRPLRRRERI